MRLGPAGIFIAVSVYTMALSYRKNVPQSIAHLVSSAVTQARWWGVARLASLSTCVYMNASKTIAVIGKATDRSKKDLKFAF
jgi:hypothetical protein